MPAHVERFPLPHHPGRKILVPIIGWAFIATLIAAFWRAARQPRLPRMSEQWLLSRQQEFAREEPYY